MHSAAGGDNPQQYMMIQTLMYICVWAITSGAVTGPGERAPALHLNGPVHRTLHLPPHSCEVAHGSSENVASGATGTMRA